MTPPYGITGMQWVNLIYAELFKKITYIYMFVFSIICQHWDVEGNWKPSHVTLRPKYSWRSGSILWLSPCIARSSINMVLAMWRTQSIFCHENFHQLPSQGSSVKRCQNCTLRLPQNHSAWKRFKYVYAWYHLMKAVGIMKSFKRPKYESQLAQVWIIGFQQLGH